MKPRSRTVRRRLWHQPELQIFVTNEQVGSAMDTPDFVRAVVAEMFGNRSRLFMLSKNDAVGRAMIAMDRVLTDMGDATSGIVEGTIEQQTQAEELPPRQSSKRPGRKESE